MKIYLKLFKILLFEKKQFFRTFLSWGKKHLLFWFDAIKLSFYTWYGCNFLLMGHSMPNEQSFFKTTPYVLYFDEIWHKCRSWWKTKNTKQIFKNFELFTKLWSLKKRLFFFVLYHCSCLKLELDQNIVQSIYIGRYQGQADISYQCLPLIRYIIYHR